MLLARAVVLPVLIGATSFPTITGKFCLELVGDGMAIPTRISSSFPRFLAVLNEMLQASQAMNRRHATQSAASVPLHAQLISSLSRNGQVREFVHNDVFMVGH